MGAALDVEKKVSQSEDGISATCVECGNGKSHMALVHYQLHKTTNLTDMKNVDVSRQVLKQGLQKSMEKKPDQTFLCKFCEKKFAEHTELKRHVLFIHDEHPGGLKTNKPPDPTLCESCCEQFPDQKCLTRHNRLKHEGFGFECDMCDYSAVTALGLMKHRSSKHGISLSQVPEEVSSSSHQCLDRCKKKFNRKFPFGRNISEVHQGGKPNHCQKCGKRSRHKQHLGRHMSV